MAAETVEGTRPVEREIAVIDGDRDVLKKLELAVGDRYLLLAADTAREALELVRARKPHLATVDLGMIVGDDGRADGLTVLREMLDLDPRLKVIVLASSHLTEAAAEAMAMGAFDCLSRPPDVGELKSAVRRAWQVRGLELENESLRSRLEDVRTVDNIIGSSPRMEDVASRLRKAAVTDAAVLILGESGTGKDLAARVIHGHSGRRRGPFITVNCGAVPEPILESELFGHEKGAFGGAPVQRRGKFELAQGGTVFLDEVGEIPLRLQSKLVQFLRQGRFERPGGKSPVAPDVRVLAATGSDLGAVSAEDSFREDLRALLGAVVIGLPPLRDRGDDAVLLACHFLEGFARDMKKDLRGFTPDALQAISRYNWPGNVRELKSKVKRGVIISQGPTVGLQDMGLEGDLPGQPLSLKAARRELDVKYIRQALQSVGGNISRASKELGISRVCLHELMKKYSLR